jgi:hypothetical protein
MIQRRSKMVRRIKIALKAGLFKKRSSTRARPEGFVSHP